MKISIDNQLVRFEQIADAGRDLTEDERHDFMTLVYKIRDWHERMLRLILAAQGLDEQDTEDVLNHKRKLTEVSPEKVN